MPASTARLEREIRKTAYRTAKGIHFTVKVSLYNNDPRPAVNDTPCPGPWDVPSQVANLLAHFHNMADRGDFDKLPVKGK